MAGTRVEVTFPEGSDGYQVIDSIYMALGEQKADVAWALSTSDDPSPKAKLDTEYLDIPQDHLVAVSKIAENPWFWQFSSEVNNYLDEDGNDCLQIDYHLDPSSKEIAQVVAWIKSFNPIKVDTLEEETYDEDDMD
ncbi:hypothetical protein [Chitinolyticbacter meiyuanensis]|uniref:hypothetical protein n=1 Tax=Chitinolyticbacter meiyuanensis TaxID=682798 RepID=UPI0011E5BFE0|nr:hypothetical protein [Chitinolyticbacter meiyuanensis]